MNLPYHAPPHPKSSFTCCERIAARIPCRSIRKSYSVCRKHIAPGRSLPASRLPCAVSTPSPVQLHLQAVSIEPRPAPRPV